MEAFSEAPGKALKGSRKASGKYYKGILMNQEGLWEVSGKVLRGIQISSGRYEERFWEV